MERRENHELDENRLAELGIHLTLGANGQVLVIKRRIGRGISETLYRWTGHQPQLNIPEILH